MMTTEHDIQVAVMRWAALKAKTDPRLELLHAVPNGGDRDVRVGARLKAEGVKRGVPDLCLPWPSGRFHGLYIELKTPKGRLSKEQEWWIEQLRGAGYRAEVCRSAMEAAIVIEEYLD